MKWTTVIACVIAAALAPEVSAQATKEIRLDANIMPTWNDLGTKPWTRKIRLRRVFKYWAAREARDKKAIKSLYSSARDDKAASAKVDAFYEGAKKCLRKQNENKRKTRKQVNKALSEIARCIQQTVTPPTFLVLATQSLPANYHEVIDLDYSGDEDETGEEAAEETGEEADDEAEEEAGEETNKGAVELQTSPSVSPVIEAPMGPDEQFDESQTATHENEEQPDTVHEINPEQVITDEQLPSEMTGLALNPDMWPFSPTAQDVPPLWALDVDYSNAVSVDEWSAYIDRLRGLAMQTASVGRDAVAVGLLKTIIDFHYDTLRHCINQKLQAIGAIESKDPDYSDIAEWVQSKCYVKFRYSLFAGVPPFEWIAKDDPTVSAADVEQWFTTQVKTARRDLETRAILVTPDHQQLVEKFIACTYATLSQADNTPVNREMFYGALREVEECARQ